MQKTPPPLERTSIDQAVHDFRSQGATCPLPWATTSTAQDLTARVQAEYGADRQEIVKNPHRDQAWARQAASSHRSGLNTSPDVRIGLNVRYVAPGAIRTRPEDHH